jgi:hypothetical protein
MSKLNGAALSMLSMSRKKLGSGDGGVLAPED